MTWGTSEWLWAIGITVASVLAILTIVVTLKSGNRPRRLLFEWEEVQLIQDRSRTRGLVVSYGDEELQDPRLVQVVLKNVGPVDISSADFNANDNLEVHVENNSTHITLVREEGDIIDVLAMRVLNADGSQETIDMFSMGPSHVDVAPMLFRRGARVASDLLVDGPVLVHLKSPLINTKIETITNAKRFSSVLEAALSNSLPIKLFRI